MIHGQQVPDPQLQRAEPVLHGYAGFGLNTAVVDQLHPAAFGFHHAPAHQRIAGIDSQNGQAIASFFIHRFIAMVNVPHEKVKADGICSCMESIAA